MLAVPIMDLENRIHEILRKHEKTGMKNCRPQKYDI